jgi:excisionase family DNA binding protein
MADDELMTTTQAADYLGVTRQAVHIMTKQGYGRRIGSVWLFTRDELERWKATPRHGGGRPKPEAGQPSPTSPA